MAFSASVLGSSNPDFLTFAATTLGGTALLMEGFQGDDSLAISADLDGASITGGQGDDSIYFNENNSQQFSVLNSTIKGGEGSDSIFVDPDDDQDVTDWLNNFLNGNGGDDSIKIEAETITGSTFQGGQGNDTIELETQLLQNNNLVNGNLGDDSIELDSPELNFGDPVGFTGASVFGGQGNDTLYADDEVIENSVFSGDLGNDSIFLDETDLTDVTVRGGGGEADGADTINIWYGEANSIFVNGNGGNDSIYFFDNNTYDSTVQGGQGNDEIYIQADNNGSFLSLFNSDNEFYDSLVNGNLGDDFIQVIDGYKGKFSDKDMEVNGSSFFGGQGQDTIDLDEASTSGDSKTTVSGNIGADLLIGGEDASISFFYRYGDTAVNASGAGRDTITQFDSDDNISVVDGVTSLAILNTTSLNNFISDSAAALNSGAAFQWYDELVDSTYVFISDGSGDLNSADVLIQVLDETRVEAPYVFALDAGKLVLV